MLTRIIKIYIILSHLYAWALGLGLGTFVPSWICICHPSQQKALNFRPRNHGRHRFRSKMVESHHNHHSCCHFHVHRHLWYQIRRAASVSLCLNMLFLYYAPHFLKFRNLKFQLHLSYCIWQLIYSEESRGIWKPSFVNWRHLWSHP